MAKQPKLSDLQLALLSIANERADGNLLPFSETISADDTSLAKAIQNLIKRGFVAETDAPAGAPAWREEGDRRLGISLTPDGTTAINAGSSKQSDEEKPGSSAKRAPTPASATAGGIKPGTKQALLVSLLERKEGASIHEIVAATKWLPHTTRAALTGLKKRRFEISSWKVDGVSRYRAKRAGQ